MMLFFFAASFERDRIAAHMPWTTVTSITQCTNYAGENEAKTIYLKQKEKKETKTTKWKKNETEQFYIDHGNDGAVTSNRFVVLNEKFVWWEIVLWPILISPRQSSGETTTQTIICIYLKRPNRFISDTWEIYANEEFQFDRRFLVRTVNVSIFVWGVNASRPHILNGLRAPLALRLPSHHMYTHTHSNVPKLTSRWPNRCRCRCLLPRCSGFRIYFSFSRLFLVFFLLFSIKKSVFSLFFSSLDGSWRDARSHREATVFALLNCQHYTHLICATCLFILFISLFRRSCVDFCGLALIDCSVFWS